MDVQLDLRFYLGRGDVSEADERFFTLLRAVDEHGSLRRASEVAGLSYRSAWGLLRTWADRLGRPAVDLHRGQGASLNEFGRKLLWANQYARDCVTPALNNLADEMRSALESLPSQASGGRLVVHASHSLAQDILREMVARESSLVLDFHNHGSLESLRHLAEGECDVAGFHLVEGPLRHRLVPEYLRWLDASAHRLVRVASRRQGLMLGSGVSDRVRGVSDLRREGIRFVNRQAGSGTRVLLDALIEDAGVKPVDIDGYNHEEFTHSAVAALLSSGAADAAFGVEAAAARFGLQFAPLASETYYFAVDEETVRTNAAVQQLVTLLAGGEYRSRVAGLKGYDPLHSGRWEPVSDLMGRDGA